MHSPPWTAPLRVSNRSQTEIRDAADDIVLSLFTVGSRETLPAIIEICNCHDALIAALRPFAELCTEIETLAKAHGPGPEGWAKVCTWERLLAARAALALAGGEE